MPTDRSKDDSFAALFESQAVRATSRARSVSPGDELDVVVIKVGRDAVFVELDGKQEGFIEAKDLTNDAGNLTVKVGSRIKAQVVEVGGRSGAPRLVPFFVRPPAAEQDDAAPIAIEGAGTGPGGAVAVGSRVKGTVALVERYGVFLQIAAPGTGSGAAKRGVRGLIPTEELGLPRGADLHKKFPLGTELEAKVIAIDERSRIKLSLVALNADVERHEFEAFEKKGKPGGATQPTQGFGTFGDLLAKKKK